MRRNPGCHTDGDSFTPIDQQLWELSGEDNGFEQLPIVVRAEVHRSFLDFVEKLYGQWAKLTLGVPHGGRTVAVHRTKVSLAVDQHVSHAEWLRESNHGLVNRGVTVRVVFGHDFTDNGRTLAVATIGKES